MYSIILGIAALVPTDSTTDVRARVAIAMSKTTVEKPQVKSPTQEDCYWECYRRAETEKLPLVVFVGQDAKDVPGAVSVRWDGYSGYGSLCVIVGFNGYEKEIFQGFVSVESLTDAAQRAKGEIVVKPVTYIQPMGFRTSRSC